MRLFAAFFVAVCPVFFGQSQPMLPGCAPRPEVQRVLDEKLSETAEPRPPGVARRSKGGRAYLFSEGLARSQASCEGIPGPRV